MVILFCSNSLLHTEPAVNGEASMMINSTEMTCAECQLPVLMLRSEQGVCLCAISQNAYWFCTVNLKHVQAVCTVA